MNLERRFWWTSLQDNHGDADRENRLVDTVREGESGTNWGNGMETYITVHKIDSEREFAGWLRELNPVLCDNLEGWEGVGDGRRVQEGGYFIHLWLIHADVWQRPTQYCKTIISQLKKKEKKRRLCHPSLSHSNMQWPSNGKRSNTPSQGWWGQ